MIEQTELIVTEWIYLPAADATEGDIKAVSVTGLDVMKKRAPTKKGIACRLSSKFMVGEETILLYMAEHSYVIDLDDTIDKSELTKMFRNSFNQFNEKFEIRKLGTVLQNCFLSPLDESRIDYNAILPLLV